MEDDRLPRRHGQQCREREEVQRGAALRSRSYQHRRYVLRERAMATKLPHVDIVIVGMGWTGGILSKELGPTGLKIAVLERGGSRSTQNDFGVPLIRDELRFSQRHDLMMDVSKD